MMDNMIDNIDEIKTLTNLSIGGIINADVKQTYMGNEGGKSGCIYDKEKYNFHLLPEDVGQFELYSRSIRKRRHELLHALDKQLKKRNMEWHIIEKSGSRGNIHELPQKTNNKYSSGGNLFSYIRIRYNGVFYDINFNRFFIKDNMVYCKLYEPQFSCCKCNPGYPQSVDAGSYSFGTMYYNPSCTFADSDLTIIEKFIEFVCKDSRRLLL